MRSWWAVGIAGQRHPLWSNLYQPYIRGEVPEFVCTLERVCYFAQRNRLGALKFFVKKGRPFVEGGADSWIRNPSEPHDFDPRNRAIVVSDAPGILRVAKIVAGRGTCGWNHHIRISVKV